MTFAKIKGFDYELFNVPFGDDQPVIFLTVDGQLHKGRVSVWEEMSRTIDLETNSPEMYKCYQWISVKQNPKWAEIIPDYNVVCWRFA